MTGVMDDRALIEKAIHDATSHLERMAASPGKRELGTRLEKMRRVVERWGKDDHRRASRCRRCWSRWPR